MSQHPNPLVTCRDCGYPGGKHHADKMRESGIDPNEPFTVITRMARVRDNARIVEKYKDGVQGIAVTPPFCITPENTTS